MSEAATVVKEDATSDNSDVNFKWRKETREGFGKQEWPDGRCYEGDFKQGKAHGNGKMTYADGATYQGKWRNDTWHGEGIFTKKTGQIIKAIFENSRLKQRL